jgi:hypothetical protein
MQLSDRTLDRIALLICGDKHQRSSKLFPYRSSSLLTNFFADCDLDYRHDGSTRKDWVLSVLNDLNTQLCASPDIPSDGLTAVIENLVDEEYFRDGDLNRAIAVAELNTIIERESLILVPDETGKYHIRNTGTGIQSSNLPRHQRPLNRDESLQRDRLEKFLDRASEDEFTTIVLVPFFQRLGFHRVDALGHREKTMEYGKDLWMKFQLPTGNWLYFCSQVKRVKVDANGTSEGNVSEVLNQARMAFDHEIFDPDINKKVLLDHLFIISAARITRAAKAWLVNHLDKQGRRHLIFMDRDDLLNHAARIVADLPIPKPSDLDSDMPF